MLENEDAQGNHVTSPMDVDDGMDGQTPVCEGGGGEEIRTKKAVREPDEARTVGKSTSKREGKRWSGKGGLFNGRKHRPDSAPRENLPSEGRKIVVIGTPKNTAAESAVPANHGDPEEVNFPLSPVTPSDLALKNRELEEALELSRREHARMQEELEQHRKQADLYHEDIQAYKEEARQDYEAQSRSNSRTSSEHDRNLELIDLEGEKEFWKQRYSEATQERSRQDKDLRAQFLERQLALRKEWDAKSIGLTMDLERAQRSSHEAQRLLDHRNDEIRELQRQVLDLKRSISTSTRTEGQVTDDVFREHIQTLGHDLQNWILNNFRRSKLGMSAISCLSCKLTVTKDMSTLSNLSKQAINTVGPTSKSLILSNRLAVIQAYMSKVLVDHIFDSLFFGLSEDRVEQMLAMDDYMKTIGKRQRLKADMLC